MNTPFFALLVFSSTCFVLVAGCRTQTSTVAVADAVAPSPAASPGAGAGVARGRHTYPKPSAQEIRAKLSPLQYEVTQHEATEPPFRNAYWNNHEAGIYVDVVTGEPLFSSADKFDSGTGWPSFTRPLDAAAVVTKTDTTLGMARIEARSTSGDSHLGHVFEDGPPPSRMRYCINSASLRFVPLARLEAEGYGTYRAELGGAIVSSPPPADSNNACAAPPPGQRAGCSTTLETAIVGADAEVANTLVKVPGVLQVERGVMGTTSAARVLYDPKTLTFAGLLDTWSRATGAATRGGGGHAKLLVINADQSKEAAAWKARASGASAITIEQGDEAAFSPSR